MVQFIDESDVDWSGKIAKTRRFSGQTYRLSGVWYFKKNANEEARYFESRGYKAAIVFKKETAPALNRKVPYYFVYTRKG